MNFSWKNIYYFEYQSRHFLYAPLNGNLLEFGNCVKELLHELKYINSNLQSHQALQLSRKLADIGFVNEDTELSFKYQDSQSEPTSVSLLITNQCNLRCMYCYANGGDSSAVLDLDSAKSAIDYTLKNCIIQNKKTLSISFHGGGEASLKMDVIKYCVRYAQKKGKEVGILPRFSIGTNGVMSKDDAVWIGSRLNSATLSVDGNAEIHDKNRPRANGNGSFENVIQTAHLWDRLRFRYNLRMTLTESSAEKLPSLIQYLCFETSARSMKAEPVYLAGRASNTHVEMPDHEVFVEAFIEAKNIAAKYGRTLVYSGARTNNIHYKFCEAEGNSLCLTPEGYVTACYEVLSREDSRAIMFFYGKYNQDKSVLEIDFKERKKQQSKISTRLSRCVDCFCRWHCAGDCPAKATFVKDNLTPNTFRCEITKAITAHYLVSKFDHETN